MQLESAFSAKLVSLLLALAVAGCGAVNEPAGLRDAENLEPARGLPTAVTHGLANSGEGDVEVEGEDIRLTFAGGPPLNQEAYDFVVNSKNGEVTGRFQVTDSDANGGFYKASGNVTCVKVEGDGITARLAGEVTRTLNNLGLPDLSGTFAVWTVIANEEGPAQVTDCRFGVAQATRDFHCAIGFPLNAFDIILPNGTVIFDSPTETTGEIEIELGD